MKYVAHASIIACLAMLSACASEQRIDPRYLYRMPPSNGPSVQNARDAQREDGRLYNESGRRVEAFMPGYTDPFMPSEPGSPPAGTETETK